MLEVVSRHKALFAIILAGLAFWIWITLPPTRLVLNPSCAIDDPVSMASELLHGKSFWRNQATAIDATIQAIQLKQADAERTRDQPPPQVPRDDRTSPYEQRMRRLSNQAEAKSQVEQLRQWHEAIDWLARCDAQVVARLKS
jgi:hypothetical protein